MSFLEINRLMLVWVICFLFPLSGICASHHAENADQAVELETVVVTGETIEDYVKKNPSQVVSINSLEIEQRNFLQVSEVLGSMPGVDVKPVSSGLGTRISIRGGGGSGSVVVLIDGRPASTMQYGGVEIDSIPVDIVKKITVFKPPVPVWLGAGAGAGAIYIETKNGQIKESSNKTCFKKNGKIRVAGGSFGQAKLSTSLKLDAGSSDFMISAGASHQEGKRNNNQKDQGHISLQYGKKADSLDFQVNAKGFVSDHGVSGPTYNPTPNASQEYKKGSLDFKLGGYAGEYTDFDVKAWVDLKELNDKANDGSTSDLDTLAGGVGADFFVSGSKDREYRLGARIEHTDIDHTLTGEHERTVGSIHGEYNFRHERFRFTTGIRPEYSSDFYFSPGVHTGVSYELTDNTLLRANAGYNENIPSFGQLYQPSHGSMDQVRGNPDLKKEEIFSFSLGLSHEFGNKNKASFSLFRTDTDDLIKYQRGSDLINRPENIGKAVKQGAELIFRINIAQNTGLDLNYVWQDTENKDNGRELSYAPEHTLKAVFKKKFKFGTKLEITARGYSEQYTDISNTLSEVLDNYITTDLKLLHPAEIFGRKSSVFLHINNLFDEDFAFHYGYPDDGLRFLCGANINF